MSKFIDARTLVNNSSNAGDYRNFRKADAGIIYLENDSDNSGDEIKIYGRPAKVQNDFWIDTWTNADLDGGTLVENLMPLPAFVKAVPQTGTWTVHVDGDW